MHYRWTAIQFTIKHQFYVNAISDVHQNCDPFHPVQPTTLAHAIQPAIISYVKYLYPELIREPNPLTHKYYEHPAWHCVYPRIILRKYRQQHVRKCHSVTLLPGRRLMESFPAQELIPQTRPQWSKAGAAFAALDNSWPCHLWHWLLSFDHGSGVNLDACSSKWVKSRSTYQVINVRIHTGIYLYVIHEQGSLE